MESITPVRGTISDRFAVASFNVNVPQDRTFEVACATDPSLFHPEHGHRRTPRNFYTSRDQGLLRGRHGQATWLVPAEQLRRFAGAPRMYYALATYGGPRGEHARFTISPDALDRVPSLALSSDFTGRTLDRARVGRPDDDARYGARPGAPMTWGGDLAFARQQAAAVYSGPKAHGYDDGYDPSLWQRSAATAPASHGPVGSYGGALQQTAPGAHEAYGAPAVALDEHSGEAYDAIAAPYDEAPVMDPPAAQSWSDEEDDEELSSGLSTSAPLEEEYEDAPALAAAGQRGELLQSQTYGRPASPATRALESLSPAQVLGFETTGRDPEWREHDVIDEPLLSIARALQDTAPAALTIADKLSIVTVVALAESGGARYAAFNADSEYNDPGHPAYQRYHIGVSWGIVQFTQRSGSLGKVLRACERRNPQGFASTFGPHAAELLRVTNATGEEERVAPVGPDGVLWGAAWKARFDAAAAVPEFQAAQNEIAITEYMDPNLQFCAWLGLDTDRALAMVYDRCIHMGNGGGRSFVARHAGPISTEQDREAALRALGHADLRAFQRSVNGLSADGRWGPMTHAAMTHALRGLQGSPVAVPSLTQMLERLASASRGQRYERRMNTLCTTSSLHDTRYRIP